MRLSAAIIMKNEAEIAQRCLDSVAQFADEIVVVDTGSTDKTKEIVARHPKARVFDSAFFDKNTHYSDFRFNIAKNEAIGRCMGEWIIWWDADDFADKENAEKIRALATGDEVRLYSFSVHFGGLIFEHCRMFKNGAGIEFDKDHSCHEYLNTLGNPHLAMRDVIIQHIPGSKHTPSGERNLAILEKDHFERGMTDQRTLFYLANAYKEAARLPEALDFYNKYLEISAWPEERFFARLYRAQVMVQMGKLYEARKEAVLCINEDYRFAEQYCLLGDISFREGDYERAEAWFVMAAKTPFPKDARLFISPYMYSGYPAQRILDCQEKKGSNTVEEAAKVNVGKVETIKVTKKDFRLPVDRQEACLAAAALSGMAAVGNCSFGVDAADPWMAELANHVDGLEPVTAARMDLALPEGLNMTGKTRLEWYCRAAGYFGNSVGPMRISIGKHEPVMPVVFQSTGWTDNVGMIADKLNAMMADDASFSEVVRTVLAAKVIVCRAGWVQHVAAAFNVPAVVLWDGPSEGREWKYQSNMSVTAWPDEVAAEARRIAL